MLFLQGIAASIMASIAAATGMTESELMALVEKPKVEGIQTFNDVEVAKNYWQFKEWGDCSTRCG
jgi:hypothetical protein